jgi:hypothetical protein
MAWADFAKSVGLSSQPKKVKTGRAWTIEDGRANVVDNFKEWIERDFQKKDGKGKVWTVTNKDGTTISLHYLTQVIGKKEVNFTKYTDKTKVKEICLALIDGIEAGKADDEIEWIFKDEQTKRKERAANKSAQKIAEQ